MSQGSDPPSGGQRGRTPTPEQWARIASPETQKIIRIATARFLVRWPHEDAADAQGLALDKAIQGTLDYIPEGGMSYHGYLQRRIGWALSRNRWQRWKRAELRAQHLNIAPDLKPDAWELLDASRRLQQQLAVVEALDTYPLITPTCYASTT